MTAIPRYRPHAGFVLLSAGFRPFFLLSAVWAALAIPFWIIVFSGRATLPSALPPSVWHVHEMVFGFGSATVAGFLLTAIPNWTGRMPLQGSPLAFLVLLWGVGRVAVMASGAVGASYAAAADLAFPLVFLLAVGREIVAGRNWRNLPMLAALALLLAGNTLVHLEALGVMLTARLGNRIGIATLLMLISFVGGRIIPSFTRNWLAKEKKDNSPPATFGHLDLVALGVAGVGFAIWACVPASSITPWAELAAGLSLLLRLGRWRGLAAVGEPLLFILHIGYGWLVVGLLLLAFDGFVPVLPQTTALHALTAGAIGTMTLAVMTRATLGHTGRSLIAGPGTLVIYSLVTLAAILRLVAWLAGAQYLLVLSLAGGAWSGAFGLFAVLYARPLLLPRVKSELARPI